MSSFIESLQGLDTSQKCIYVVGGVVVTVATAVIIKNLLHKKERQVYPRDTVILHQLPRGPYAPSMSPWAMKLETYLRMAKIPYQNVHDFKPGPKHKSPWIEYNGAAMSDSTLCIDYLNKKLDIDFNKHLSPIEKGIAQSMQVLVEEHLYWILVLFRWKYDTDKTMMHQAFKFSRIYWWMGRRFLSNQTWAQGLGRHTRGEITLILKKDLQALSDFLDEKNYLMGDEISEVDFAVFGELAQYHWQFIGNGHDTIIKDDYPNLAAYCQRMKTRFWPDWDECITHGGTREATK